MNTNTKSIVTTIANTSLKSLSRTFKISSQFAAFLQNSQVWPVVKTYQQQPSPSPYQVTREITGVRVAVPETIALSPIEDSFGTFEDLASLFAEDVTSPKPLPLITQSSSAIFSSGE